MNNQRPARVKQISSWFLFAFIALLPFSYYPLVSFGSLHATHLDGSLLYISAVLVVASSIPILWIQRDALQRSKPLLWLGGYVLFSFLSTMWSANPVRGVITATFLFLIAALTCVVALKLQDLKRHQQLIYRTLSASIGISIIWALWQIYGDAFGVPHALTLLPSAYESGVFGVARPTGFALEPQFFASFLLIPFFWLGMRQLNSSRATSPLYTLGLIALSAILALSLSRGAVYAAGLGLIALFVLNHHHLKRWLGFVVIILAGMVLAGVIAFSAATVNQRDTITGYGSISKSLNHLSLGALSLPAAQQKTTTNPSGQSKKAGKESGYVASSTSSRLSMSAQAISLWSQSPQRIIFGIGTGGFGTTLHEKDRHYSPSSIVNNYYLEVLVETGIIGFTLLVVFFTILLYRLLKAKQTLLLVILISLLVQACFYSGNANIIHLWTIVGIAVGVLLSQTKKPLHLVQ